MPNIPSRYFLFAGGIGFAVLVLQILKQKVMVQDMETEIFGLILAIIFTIFGVLIGLLVFRKRAQLKISHNPNVQNELSKREIDVLELLAAGNSNQEIADKLFVSLNTAKTHISNIYLKLNVKRRTQAVHKAQEMGVINPEFSLEN